MIMRCFNIFGKDIPIREYGCSNKENAPLYIKTPRFNIFIQLTNDCNANCPFCIYHSSEQKTFDLGKLSYIIKYLHQNADIGKINFTGGEPTLNLDLFYNVVECVSENIVKLRKPEITLNTNGINLLDVLPVSSFFDSIGLSRHHYDDKINSKIFNCSTVPTKNIISEFQSKVKNKNLIQLRCNLISGYIDCYDEILKYLNQAIDIGCHDCGFVTLMPNNDFCLNHQVDFPRLMHEDENIIEVDSWTRDDDKIKECVCRCSNYIYQNENGEFCRFYRRHFCRNDLTEGQLVYDGQNLRYGFGGEIII